MKKLRVYIGKIYDKTKEYNAVVAADNKEELTEILNTSRYFIDHNWKQTWDNKFRKPALEIPHTIVYLPKI